DDRAFFRAPIRYGEFYPTERYARMLAGLRARLGPEALDELSAYLAEQDLKGLFLVFARMLSKEFLINRMGDMWGKFHTEGRLELIRSTSDSVGVRVADLELTEDHCRSTEIYFRRVLELATKQTYRSERRVVDPENTEYWYHRAGA
ncbi:MAG TPA: hypothetical protein P5076_00510, partial [Myxococcota bacterium]|nr:hypothetical protein [Myxococcota bacterium]